MEGKRIVNTEACGGLGTLIQMKKRHSLFSALVLCVAFIGLQIPASASAYDAHPKLVVVIIIDQFRGDYLDRGHDSFEQGGFRLFMEKGAWFSNCNYEYANTRTAPGHATLFTGAYSNGHGIINNEWWDAAKKKVVTSVDDDMTSVVGLDHEEMGSSPHYLLADTVGDELRMATDGKARVFAISMKERSSVLPAGYSGTAFWPDKISGSWITSTYYMKELPQWVVAYNQTKPADKFWNREWKVGDTVLRSTNKPGQLDKKENNFYEIVGSTPYANDFELDFARQMIAAEKLGQGEATDMLLISLSANDILGHKVGPNTPESKAMTQALDGQLASFFDYLGKEIGLGNVWIALSADHGVSTAPSFLSDIKVPSAYLSDAQITKSINTALSTKYGKAEYVPKMEWPLVFLDPAPFMAAKISEDDAERMVGDMLKPYGSRGTYTRAQIAKNDVPNDSIGKRFLNSYTPQASWFVYAVSPPFFVARSQGTGTDHAMPWSYDRHVPLAFYGLPFQPGVYRGACQPVDLAVTLANLLGINNPSAAVGRVLTEALRPSTTEAGR